MDNSRMYLNDADQKLYEQMEALKNFQLASQSPSDGPTEPLAVNIPSSMLSNDEPQTELNITKPMVITAKPPSKKTVAKNKEEALPKSSDGPAPPELKPQISDLISQLLNSQNKNSDAAVNARNSNQLIDTLAKAGSQIGAGLSRAPEADTSGLDALYKSAGESVDDLSHNQKLMTDTLKTQQAKESLSNDMAKEDPKSDISKIGREILQAASKQAGHTFEIPQNISLSNMEKLLPGIEGMANRRLQSQALAARTKDARDDKQAMLDQRIESQTNNQVKAETGDYTRNLDQATRTQDMFKDLRAGKYKSASNIIGALQSDVSSLLTGAKQTAVYDRSHAEINALEKTMNGYISYLQSKPKNLLPDNYLGQLEEEVKTLKKAVIKNYARKNNEMMSGTNNPVKKELINNRFSTQLNELGYDPKTLESKSELSDKEPAIQSFMQANGIKDRDEAIKILKENGRL
jgi:hypothetical protein